LRALSDVSDKKLPYDSLGSLRIALFGFVPHLARVDQIAPATQRHRKVAGAARPPTKRVSVRLFRTSTHQSDRTRVRIMANAPLWRARPRTDGRGVAQWPNFDRLSLAADRDGAQSVLLLVILLVAIAYVSRRPQDLGGVQIRRGRT